MVGFTYPCDVYFTCPSKREPKKTFGRGRLGRKQDKAFSVTFDVPIGARGDV